MGTGVAFYRLIGGLGDPLVCMYRFLALEEGHGNHSGAEGCGVAEVEILSIFVAAGHGHSCLGRRGLDPDLALRARVGGYCLYSCLSSAPALYASSLLQPLSQH